ncbi:MAG: hypothetical protein QN717_07050 [Nitrososphaeraceae archaeon]|nr:hypothetical protein [Nitrososphaeraceae archaeon]
MSDNNEERREDRNRKKSLEEDKSILQERIDLFEKSLANTGIGLKLTRRANPYHKEQSSRVSKVTNGDGKV